MTEMLYVNNVIFHAWHVTFTDSINAKNVMNQITDFLIPNQVSVNVNQDSLRQEYQNVTLVITPANSAWITNLNAYHAWLKMFLLE